MNNSIINRFKLCQQVINDRVYRRKRQLYDGYIYGGGTTDKPLSRVSFNNFYECLTLV